MLMPFILCSTSRLNFSIYTSTLYCEFGVTVAKVVDKIICCGIVELNRMIFGRFVLLKIVSTLFIVAEEKDMVGGNSVTSLTLDCLVVDDEDFTD